MNKTILFAVSCFTLFAFGFLFSPVQAHAYNLWDGYVSRQPLTAKMPSGTIEAVKPTFIWTNPTTEEAMAQNYTLQVSTTEDFSTPIFSVNISLKSSSYTITKLLPKGVPLYWKIRKNYQPGNHPAAYSNILQFRIANPPSVPVLTSPANGALVSIVQDIKLSWRKSSNMMKGYYQIQVSGDPKFNSYANPLNIIVNDRITSTTITGSEFYNYKYYWRVRAGNVYTGEIEWSNWSSVRYYKTRPEPSKPPLDPRDPPPPPFRAN